MGKADERTLRFGHEKLSTFGIGEEHSKPAWQSIFRQLVAHHLLAVNMNEHGGLYITEKGSIFIKEKESISLREYKKIESKKSSRNSKTTKVRRILSNESDQKLFDLLREKRMVLAKKHNIPPYIIFHDSTLIEMAKQKPQSKQAMLAIMGVGQKKIERYGAEFLEIISA